MESASSYAIDSAVFGNDPNQVQNSDIDPDTQKKRMKIIKEILDNFDLEETKERYRSLNHTEYSMDPSYLSVDSSMEGLRIKERIEYLMGSDVIQVGNNAYNEKLRERLQQEYNEQMDRRERELAQQEQRRVRRLVLQGILHSSDEEDGACLHSNRHNTSQKAKTKKQQKRSPRRNRSQRTTSGPIEGTADDNATLQSDRLSPYLEKEDSAMKTYMDTDQNTSSDSSPTKEQSIRDDRTPERCRSSTDTDASSSSNQSDQDSRIKDGVAPRRQDHHDPIVRKLHTEETVQGLYRLANILVSPRSDERLTSSY